MGKKVISLQPLRNEKAARQTADNRILSSEIQPEPRRNTLPEQVTSVVAEAMHQKRNGTAEKAPNSGTLPLVLSRLPLLQVPLTSKYYLTVREAAALAGLSVAHIRRAIADAVLPALRSGGYRIKREDLERL